MGLRQVAIKKSDGLVTVSVKDFFALPLDQRVQFILEKQLEFYDDQGARLSTLEGLRLLRELRGQV